MPIQTRISVVCCAASILPLTCAPRPLAATPPVQPLTVTYQGLSPSVGGNSDSLAGQMSADGRFVVFVSTANNLVTDDHAASPLGSFLDVFLRDLTTGQTTLVSANSAGTDSGNKDSNDPAVSADGRFVAFQSDASDLVTNDFNLTSDIFVRDVVNGRTILVSMNAAGSGLWEWLVPHSGHDSRRAVCCVR